MKKFVLTLALGFGMSAAVFAQDNVPERVRTSFNNSYAQASDVEWKTKDNKHHAKFEMNGDKHWIVYNADGSVEKHGREIEVSELPQAVRSAISQQYANRTIEKAKTVEKDGVTRYMAKLDGDDEDLKVVFNADGSVEKEKDKDKRKN